MSRQVELDPQWKSQLGAATIAEREREAREAEEARQGKTLDARLARVGYVVSTFLGPIVIVDFVLGFGMLFVVYAVTGSMPGGVVLAGLLGFVGLCRRATLQVRWGGVLGVATLFLFAFLALESWHNHMPWKQRLFKFGLLFVMCLTLASGRINIRSFILGGVTGALLNVPLFYAGLTSNNYPPYLTGFYGDKNIAGLYYALWGLLGLQVIGKKLRIPWSLLFLVLLILTGSRTATGGFLLGLGWVLLRNRIGVTPRVMLALTGLWGLVYAITNFAENSAFGDRTSTDWYRHQIELAMTAKADMAPWYGMGLNQGYVVLGVRRQWFHDSYLQAFVEGGYPFLWFTLFIFVVLGLGLFDRRLHISYNLLTAEAAIVAILVCAWKLGEVFMTIGAFVVLGICIAYRLGRPAERSGLAWVVTNADDEADMPQRTGGGSHASRVA